MVTHLQETTGRIGYIHITQVAHEQLTQKGMEETSQTLEVKGNVTIKSK